MHILYITYGSGIFHAQTRLSIYSLLRWWTPDRITVLSTDPSAYGDLGVRTLLIPPAELPGRIGVMGYHFRVKIIGIRQFAGTTGEPFVYVDSDSFWRRSPADLAARLDAGTWLMERRENTISPTFFPRFHRFLERRGRAFARAGLGFAPAQRAMYIAGLIGVPAHPERAAMLTSVLEVNDFVTLNCPAFNWAEQFAFCSVLGARARLEEAPGYIEHYWGCNTEMQVLLGRLSDAELRTIGASDVAFDELQARARALQKDPAHRRFLRRRKHKRSFQRRFREIRSVWERFVIGRVKDCG